MFKSICINNKSEYKQECLDLITFLDDWLYKNNFNIEDECSIGFYNELNRIVFDNFLTKTIEEDGLNTSYELYEEEIKQFLNFINNLKVKIFKSNINELHLSEKNPYLLYYAIKTIYNNDDINISNKNIEDIYNKIYNFYCNFYMIREYNECVYITTDELFYNVYKVELSKEIINYCINHKNKGSIFLKYICDNIDITKVIYLCPFKAPELVIEDLFGSNNESKDFKKIMRVIFLTLFVFWIIGCMIKI